MIKRIIDGLDREDLIRKKYFFILFSILVLAISLFGLNGSLQNVDEVLYARVSRESLEEGSWLIQIKDGKQIFFKAPMVFWTAMLSFKLFGVSDFTARLPSAIANIVSSFIILFICIKTFNSYKTGIMAVLIYLCSLQVNASSHQICADLLVLMFLLLSLFFSLKGIKDNKLWFLLAGFFNGFAYLSKSVLGFAIPAALLIYIIIRRRGDLFVYLIMLVFISFIFSIPFYLYINIKLPTMFKENFLINYLLGIVYTKGSFSIFDVLFRLLYYLTLLLLFILPFSPGLLFVFFRKGEESKAKNILWNDLSSLISIYLLVLLIGFSLIRQKMAHYTLFMIPVLAIFLGESLKNIKNRKIYLFFASVSAITVIVFLVIYGKEGHRYPTYRDFVYGLIIIYALFSILNIIFFLRKIDAKIGVFSLVFIFFISYTIHTAITVPLDFNSDIKSFADVYKNSAPIVVISTREVNEGSKTRVTIWYMRKRSKQYKTFEHFLEASGEIEKGTYLIFYNGYSDELQRLYESFKILKTGKIWSIGVVR